MPNFFFIFCLALISSCAIQDQKAEIKYHHIDSYSKKDYETKLGAPPANETKDLVVMQETDEEVILPKARPAAPRSAEEVKYHEVKRGETLEQIAGRYKVEARELRRINNLPTGEKVEEYDILKIPPNPTVSNI